MASSSSSSSSSNSEQPAAEETRNWLELPRDVTATILLKLGAVEIIEVAQKVCMSWRSICKDPAMWRSIDMWNLGDLGAMDYDLEKMAMHAIDLSDGQLADINIEYFGTDELLVYLAERASQLKRLRLVCCYSISDEGLCEAVQKFPLLEKLHIYFSNISKESLTIMGRACPNLKSFKFNNQGYRRPHVECDEVALAIADSMPELRHLQLFGNKLTNDGLVAILDGCPKLESLDLRQCFNLNLGGNIGRRLSGIEVLRRPLDSTEDYGFSSQIQDVDSCDDEYPYGFSDIDFISDDDQYYEFSGDSDFSDYDDFTIPEFDGFRIP